MDPSSVPRPNSGVEAANWDGSGQEGQGLNRAWPQGGLPLVARLDFRPGFEA